MASYDLNDKQSEQFAQMLLAGVSPHVAVKYFFPENHPAADLDSAAKNWPTRKSVQEAIDRLNGKKWLTMDPKERWQRALDKNYNEKAFFLMTHNYGELDGPALKKADACVESLEKKIAGTVGTEDPLVRLYNDVLSGKVKLSPVAPEKTAKPLPVQLAN